MWCNQIFSFIYGGKVQNVVVCDNFEVANQISHMTYGSEAFAVDTTQYPVTKGCKYIDGVFYDADGNAILKSPTEVEIIAAMKEHQAEMKIDVDYRLSLIELGLM